VSSLITRIAELDRLNCVDEAAFNAGDTRSSCLLQTREDLLEALQEWADNPNAKQVCWLSGQAGSGKSTIAQSFANWLFIEDKLGGSFFCSRESDRRSSTQAIFPTVAYQIATSTNRSAPQFRESIVLALKANPKIATLSLQNQLEKLLVGPARDSGIQTVIVIDALDECKDEETTSIMFKFLDRNVKHLPNIKFFITSRPEMHIRVGFRLEDLRMVTDVMVLHEVTALSVNDDIMLFLKTKLARTSVLAGRSDLSLPEEWPSQAQLEELTTKSGGLFIYASTVVKLILHEHGDPKSQLEDILNQCDTFGEEGNAHLDKLYQEILGRVYRRMDDKQMDRRRAILGLLVVARVPLSATAIASILGIERVKDVKTCLRGLHSVLVIPEDLSKPILFHHKSFPDFLTSQTRCTFERFYIDQDQHHFSAAACCFVVMDKKLKRNICGLKRYSTNDSVATTMRDQRIDESLRYSSLHWSSHLLSISGAYRDNRMHEVMAWLDKWIKTKLLQWIEVLALVNELGRAVKALSSIQEMLTVVRVS
jgi:hypothetical protein